MKDPKVLHILHQPTQINHRVSVVLPYDGGKLIFCGVDGVGRWRSGHRLSMRIGGDEAYDTNTPICSEALGDLGTDVGRVGGFAFDLGIDALKSGLVGDGIAAW